ncbi:MAG TPA: F-box protein, partial [Planctomycetes bacterium]|nr:F-box protein [Planctomycetota bacterium]
MRLPYDIVCVVFVYLPAEAVAKCQHVCTEWRAAALAERRRRAHRLALAAMAWVEANPGELVLAGSMALWLSEGAPTRWFPGDVDVFYCAGVGSTDEKTISCGADAFGFMCANA